MDIKFSGIPLKGRYDSGVDMSESGEDIKIVLKDVGCNDVNRVLVAHVTIR